MRREKRNWFQLSEGESEGTEGVMKVTKNRVRDRGSRK